MKQSPGSYYTLTELLAQRTTCVALGMNPATIEYEIALVVEQESMASRLRHPSSGPRPFDQDVD